MKTKILTSTLWVCLFVICLATTGGITGKWTGKVKTLDSIEIPLNYNFIVDGDKLTGTGQSTQGILPILDGKIDGNDFTFNLAVTGGMVKHSCKYYAVGDSVAMDIDYNGYKFHSTLKRSDK